MPGLLVALVAGMASIGMTAAEPAQAKLLLNIIVDGLDTDYLDLLRSHFGEGGFRRLERDGAVILNADYGPGLDAAAATATVMTGASPSVHGIGSAKIYDPERFREISAYNTTDANGQFSATNFSPAALRVSTVADEVRISAGGVNVAYAVAPAPEQALALSGHAANSSLWLDVKNANWTTSSYFREMPGTISARNRMQPLIVRMDTMNWTPSLDPAAYPALPDHLKRYPFRYVFPRSNSQRLDMFCASPLVNREVTAVIQEMLGNLKIGQHEGVTDVLSLSYTLQPFTFGKATDNRPELMDAYIKLDLNLEQLFNDIDRRIGLHNSVVMLAATPPSGRSRRDDDQWGIPAGEFSTRKAASLLNIYLIAIYGNGDYVSAFHNGHIYLNHKLLQDRSVNEQEIRRQCANFLSRMTGVDRVFTIDDIIDGRAGEQPEALRRNTVGSTAGDLLVKVAPGFEVLEDYGVELPSNRIHMSERVVGTTAPVYIMAPGIAPQTIGTPVDVRTIAPTVCRILRIRSPNGAAAAPLHLLKK